MSFKKLVEEAMTLSEKSPPGFKGTVKAMKDHDDIDNPYALAWWMKNKGYQSHKKADGTDVKESVRVSHPLHGTGTVEAITEDTVEITWDNLEKRLSESNTLAFSDAKYLTRLDTSEPVKESKKPMKQRKTKQKVDESVVAVGMAAVPGTERGGTETAVQFEDDVLRFDDLLSEDDDWKKPWEEDDSDDDGGTDDDRAENMDGDQHGLRDAEDTREYDGADYTNVPRPSDSVLTNQEDQPAYHANPLSTMAGAEAAGDGDSPDGDYETDLKPVDAPDTPKVRDEEHAADRGNTRDAGDDSDDTSEVDAGDYDESKPEDTGGEDEMSKKNESAWLDAEDLGLELMEMGDPMGGMDFDQPMGEMGHMHEHEMGGGEVALTREFMDKLCAAISRQAPDEAKCKALCDGLEAAQQEKGDMALGVEDWDSVKSHAAAAFSGGGSDMGDEPDMGGGDYEGGDDYEGGPDDMGGAPDEMEECGYAEGEYEDRAEGDGERAGPEGGPEHEGKTKMMDQTGDVAVAENSGTPIGTGNTSGSGGGSQKDLSKPKAYHGKPVGTGTSGPGGSSADEYGQKPHKDGGSNLLPAYEKGSKHGTPSTAFDGDAEKPAPRRTKPLAAEDKKAGSNGKKKLDEHIMLGMSAIQGTIRDDGTDVPEDADWDDEIATIKRRAGYEEWWK